VEPWKEEERAPPALDLLDLDFPLLKQGQLAIPLASETLGHSTQATARRKEKKA
jgi:hypothetical protein